MKLTPFRAMYATLIVLLMVVIAGQWWSNSTHKDITMPTLRYFACPGRASSPCSSRRAPRQAPRAWDGNPIPPDATPHHFNEGTFYILPIS